MTEDGVPRIALSTILAIPEGPDQYPMEYVEAHGALKIEEKDDYVVVGFSDPTDERLRSQLTRYHGKPLRIHAVDKAELAELLAKRSSAGGLILTGANSLNSTANDPDRLTLDKLANDAPVINLLNGILIEAIRRGASDIHIDPWQNTVSVRYRIDGVLCNASTIDTSLFPAIASRIKIMANLNIMERRLPQDGRITVTIGGESVDMRVSIVPVVAGESIVLRLFNRSTTLLDLDELGFPKLLTGQLRRLLTYPHGLFLVTGPTGSGKTTTLSAILRRLASERKKVVSIEDPVEYLVTGVDQIQIHEKIGLSFSTLLRRVLRQDPDIIMVGEIRDGETAELAVRAALTGHLVLSTLHTNDAVSTVPRLLDMGVPPYLLAATLRGVLAQRLVRKVCPVCRKTQPTRPAGSAHFRSVDLPSPDAVPEPVGCTHCNMTGYHGRRAFGELMVVDEGVERLIAQGADAGALRTRLRESGYVTLEAAALSLVSEGSTTLDEIAEAGL